MGDPKHVDVLNQGVPAWNRWRRENPLVIPNLSGAELKNAKLGGIDFSWAYFGYGTPGTQGVYFEAGIHEANLTGVHLSYANLEWILEEPIFVARICFARSLANAT
jgi:Pentapeptide repeats (8 copies)